jgi:hypothetical protein
MKDIFNVKRRDFLRTGGILGAGLVLGTPSYGQEKKEKSKSRIKTNIDDFLKEPKTLHSLPGLFPGKVVQVHDSKAMVKDNPDPKIIEKMITTGIEQLSGKSIDYSFQLYFKSDDVIGIKVNPVGPGLISTRLEVVDVVIDWLVRNGVPQTNIIIWDRFDYMLTDAGFTPERYPGIEIVGLQTMDEKAASGEKDDDSNWLDKDGKHISRSNFDKGIYYWADVDGPKDKPYLNQHVYNEKFSYFGKLITERLTKIINIPVFKNTGNGISMATKNIAYGAICNTARLHRPLFFDVCTEVLAHPVIRDKMVLNITDGLRAQYDGGPGAEAKFTYIHNTLYFATDPFALDMTCHNILLNKRKEMKVKINEHPRYTEYLRYAERLNLGIADPQKIDHIIV